MASVGVETNRDRSVRMNACGLKHSWYGHFEPKIHPVDPRKYFVLRKATVVAGEAVHCDNACIFHTDHGDLRRWEPVSFVHDRRAACACGGDPDKKTKATNWHNTFRGYDTICNSERRIVASWQLARSRSEYPTVTADQHFFLNAFTGRRAANTWLVPASLPTRPSMCRLGSCGQADSGGLVPAIDH
jgi:hypothetical protein